MCIIIVIEECVTSIKTTSVATCHRKYALKITQFTTDWLISLVTSYAHCDLSKYILPVHFIIIPSVNVIIELIRSSLNERSQYITLHLLSPSTLHIFWSKSIVSVTVITITQFFWGCIIYKWVTTIIIICVDDLRHEFSK